MTVKLNTTGLYYYKTILQIADKCKEIEPGEFLEVVLDDSKFIKDIRLWCKRFNKELLSVSTDEEGKIKCLIQC